MSGLSEALTDLAKLVHRANAVGDSDKFVRLSGKVISKLSEELRKFDHPDFPKRYCNLCIRGGKSVRFYIATGVFYDSTPGPELDAFIDMVKEFYRDHTELAPLECEEEATRLLAGEIVEPKS